MRVTAPLTKNVVAGMEVQLLKPFTNTLPRPSKHSNMASTLSTRLEILSLLLLVLRHPWLPRIQGQRNFAQEVC
jgi:hypothetical protein